MGCRTIPFVLQGCSIGISFSEWVGQEWNCIHCKANQAPVVYPTVAMAPRMDKVSGIDVFPHPMLGSVMNGIECKLLTKFLNMKPPTFQGTQYEDELLA